MSIINNVLGLFLGNKYERDIKEINPYVDRIRQEFEKLGGLSNDELRERTEAIRKEIHDSIITMNRK
jgi:preprotein translocase subunit SecA